MMEFIIRIGRSALPLFAVIALAFVLSQFSITANAGTVSIASGQQDCCGPCDPSDCPMPCAVQCTGAKSAVCPDASKITAMAGCQSACVSVNSTACEPCPIPCSGPCDLEKESRCTKTVADLK